MHVGVIIYVMFLESRCYDELKMSGYVRTPFLKDGLSEFNHWGIYSNFSIILSQSSADDVDIISNYFPNSLIQKIRTYICSTSTLDILSYSFKSMIRFTV